MIFAWKFLIDHEKLNIFDMNNYYYKIYIYIYKMKKAEALSVDFIFLK